MNPNAKLLDLKRDVVKKNFSVAIHNALAGHIIYRGKSASGWLLTVVIPQKTRRKSANTNEIYNTLIDIIPSWKDWPKRSRSIICSTSIDGAAQFGDIHMVLPKNNARIGVCSRGDFWVSFKNVEKRLGIDTMEDFNNIIYRMLKYVIYSGTLSYGKTEDNDFVLDSFRQLEDVDVDVVTKAIGRTWTGWEYGNSMKPILIEDMDKYYDGSWLEYFSELLDPVKNGFKLISTNEFPEVPVGREIWTDSVSILYATGVDRPEVAEQRIENFLQSKSWD